MRKQVNLLPWNVQYFLKDDARLRNCSYLGRYVKWHLFKGWSNRWMRIKSDLIAFFLTADVDDISIPNGSLLVGVVTV